MRYLADRMGRRVRLTEERRAHILAHPEMAELADHLSGTLRDPELAVRSSSDPSVELTYRFIQRTIVGAKWLCVVVKYAREDAFVLTAYLTDKPKKGDQLWPSP